MAVSAFAEASRSERVLAEINITPLIDVMLVLLIIFMVAAPVLTRELDVRLPQPNPEVTATPPRLSLVVQGDGSLQLDGRVLSSASLREALVAIAQRAPNTVLVLSANADADYQGVTRALALARSSGIANIAL